MPGLARRLTGGQRDGHGVVLERPTTPKAGLARRLTGGQKESMELTVERPTTPNTGIVHRLTGPLRDDRREHGRSPQSPDSPRKHRAAARKAAAKPALKLATVAHHFAAATFSPDYPEQRANKTCITAVELAHVALHQGKPDEAIRLLQSALDAEQALSWRQFELSAQLGASLSTMGDFAGAKEQFHRCQSIATQLAAFVISECCVLEANAAACWALGNIGLAALQLYHMDAVANAAQLDDATERFNQQIQESRALQKKFTAPGLRLVDMQLGFAAKATRRAESFGLNRVLLCYAAKANAQMVECIGEETCRVSEKHCDREPLSLARLCYAYSLAAVGKRQAAIEQIGFLSAKLVEEHADAEATPPDPWSAMEQAMQPARWAGAVAHRHRELLRPKTPKSSTLDKLRATTPVAEKDAAWQRRGGLWGRAKILLRGAIAFRREPG